MKYWLLFLCLFAAVPSWSENTYYRFRVYLKDKGNQTCNTDHPEAFLSEAAILRREQQQIPVSYSDLPISNSYKEQLANCGCALITESRWLSTVVVEYPDSSLVEKLKRLAFVDSVCWVWKGKHIPLQEPDHTETLHIDKKTLRNRYGYAQKQIRMMKGDKLHKRGFKGEGMRIAVIDAGFTDVNRIDAFASTHIEGTRNIVYPGKTVYASDAHGTKVLSCLAANLPGIMTGTAPEATYWLIKSEDSNGESPIEQDYWAAAVEYADSVGAYIISSSLGYFDFDEPATDYTHEDLAGWKAFISQAAQMAAEKGLLVFTSAGNEGNTRWEKITVPADTPDILTVGAVTEKQKRSDFSSMGPTADGRIKPDVAAMGTNCCVIEPGGFIRQANGTSFSTPILAGLGACLWQALPQLNAAEIRALIKQYASQAKQPDNELGFGVPNMYKSYKAGLKDGSKRRR